MIHMASTFASPYLPGQYMAYQRTNLAANLQATGPTGPSAFSRRMHMPHEVDGQLRCSEADHGLDRGRGELQRATTGVSFSGPDIVGRFPSRPVLGWIDRASHPHLHELHRVAHRRTNG